MRYVALGDSLTEGVGDPIADGSLRGWADMLAGALKRSNPDLDYRNLARRSLTAAQVRQSQLEPALAVAPDLASVAVGMNDVLAPSFDKNSFERDLVSLVHPLIESGATVLVGTLPEDLPLLRLMRGKAAATRSRLKTVGAVVGAVCGDLGALVVDAPEE
ncbi:MAG TPA: SGNH/GDSL hydrolase family protein, partial [Actinomycetota bacterium]|nr:SGNH/GDSL hydrolase family protein [Actinomycetota bacterium]